MELMLKPGHAFIFNNTIFDDASNAVRIGSAADVRVIKDTFKYYDLKITVIDNANLDKIRSTVKTSRCIKYKINKERQRKKIRKQLLGRKENKEDDNEKI